MEFDDFKDRLTAKFARTGDLAMRVMGLIDEDCFEATPQQITGWLSRLEGESQVVGVLGELKWRGESGRASARHFKTKLYWRWVD